MKRKVLVVETLTRSVFIEVSENELDALRWSHGKTEAAKEHNHQEASAVVIDRADAALKDADNIRRESLLLSLADTSETILETEEV